MDPCRREVVLSKEAVDVVSLRATVSATLDTQIRLRVEEVRMFAAIGLRVVVVVEPREAAYLRSAFASQLTADELKFVEVVTQEE